MDDQDDDDDYPGTKQANSKENMANLLRMITGETGKNVLNVNEAISRKAD